MNSNKDKKTSAPKVTFLKFFCLAFSLILLFTSVVFSDVQASYSLSESEVFNIAEDVGSKYGISPEFLTAVAYYESRYKPSAKNGSCTGLMQVSSRWHSSRMRKLGVSNLNDPYGNMLVAADYLHELFEKYEDPAMVLMTYNGDSRAKSYWNGSSNMSTYAHNILEKSQSMERMNNK